MFKEINLRNHSSLHKLFYSLMRSAKNKIFNYLQQYNKENGLDKLISIPQISYLPTNHSKLNRPFVLKNK